MILPRFRLSLVAQRWRELWLLRRSDWLGIFGGLPVAIELVLDRVQLVVQLTTVTLGIWRLAMLKKDTGQL